MIAETMRQALWNNLVRIRQRIAAAAAAAGRQPDEVQLIAVTKYVDTETAQSLVELGQLNLAESRPQALWRKADQISNPAVQWHLVGHLQRNKIARTLPLCHWIHSVDSLRLLEAIDAATAAQHRQTACLLEINISGESAKHGFSADSLAAVLDVAINLNHIKILGLMGMGSLGVAPDTTRREFASLRELQLRFSQYESNNISLKELSMGMSDDFEIAIHEGATVVRIGSVLFEGIKGN